MLILTTSCLITIFPKLQAVGRIFLIDFLPLSFASPQFVRLLVLRAGVRGGLPRLSPAPGRAGLHSGFTASLR